MSQLSLSDAELNIMLEMLETERAQLLVDTRRTDARKYRARLQQRLDSVESLIGQVKLAREAAASSIAMSA